MERGDDKTRMALSDLLRLLILDTAPSAQINHILVKNWDKLVSETIIKHICSHDLTKPAVKGTPEHTLSNFNLMSLKFLGNIFLTDDGYDIMQDRTKTEQLISYCQKSMTSANEIIVKVAIEVLTNLVLDISRIKHTLFDPLSKCMS